MSDVERAEAANPGWKIQRLNPLNSELAQEAKAPHVLLAVDQFTNVLGGGERVALRLAALLPRYGVRASLLTLDISGTAYQRYLAGTPMYLLAPGSTVSMTAARAAVSLSLFLREQNVRIVHSFFESSDLWVGSIAKFGAGVKLIWSRRDMGILRGPKHHLAYRLLASAPDRVFAVSEQVRRHAIEVDRIPPERVETIYNGLDLDRFDCDRAARGGSAPLITTVGNIRRVKGHDVFLRAAAIVAQAFPAARFSVAGDVLEPEFYAELLRLRDELGLTARFEFVGSVTDLSRHLCAADLFVLPSRSEGFSNSIIEAMAASLPVVATDVGGNAEAVADGTTGRIVPPENATALAAALCEMLANRERASAFGRAGRERVAERFTTDAMMRKTVTAYRRVLGFGN